ncbi:MAG: hypothetical protein ACJARF_001416, partial [Alteromonadaceae bacterium]
LVGLQRIGAHHKAPFINGLTNYYCGGDSNIWMNSKTLRDSMG